MLISYQTATNWTYFSSRFVRIESGNLITFIISNTEYQAEEGMTWAEWCSSNYNTGGYYVKTNNQIENNIGTVVQGDFATGVAVLASQIIIPGEEYGFIK